MSLIKVPFLLSDAIGMRITGTPPNPPVPPKEHIIPDWRERFLKHLVLPCMFFRGMYWSVGAIEAAVIIANRNPSSPISNFILYVLVLDGDVQNIRVTPLFVVGNTISLYGTILRMQCYRSLGKFFTFELCIKDDHRLVIDGPYSFIRHPSYTAIILTILGYCCSNATGSWIRECGLLKLWIGRMLVLTWMVIAGAVIISLILRIPREDEILRKKFGVEWEKWVERVPYCLIPGLY